MPSQPCLKNLGIVISVYLFTGSALCGGGWLLLLRGHSIDRPSTVCLPFSAGKKSPVEVEDSDGELSRRERSAFLLHSSEGLHG